MIPTLPGTIAPNGARVMIGRPGIRDPDTSTVDQMIRAILTVIDVVGQEDEEMGVCGMNMIIDAQNLSFAHVAQTTLPVIKKMSTIIQVMMWHAS